MSIGQNDAADCRSEKEEKDLLDTLKKARLTVINRSSSQMKMCQRKLRSTGWGANAAIEERVNSSPAATVTLGS